jgi:hypothetical protein
MNDLWIPLLPFAVFFAWLFFSGMRRCKVCPDCDKPLPRIQSPFTKTWRQWVEGGYVCQNCGCEADIAGRKVPAGTAPQRRSIIIGIGLLTLSVVPAIVLLTMLCQR